MADRHEKREITIFQTFAKICDLSIKPNSVEKKNPPKPDIQCEVWENGLLPFELVEIIDRNFANMSGKQVDTKTELSRYHSNLPPEKKVRFDRIYSNALIFPRFQNRCTLRQREKLFPVIIEHLLTLDKKFKGDTFENTTEYGDKLSGISISRGRFSGPLFDLVAGGSIGDPTVSAIRSKFGKTYKSDHPVHLLGYIDLNPMFPEDIWLPSVEEFVKASINKCQFEKVWIFDFQKSEIKFVYP